MPSPGRVPTVENSEGSEINDNRGELRLDGVARSCYEVLSLSGPSFRRDGRVVEGGGLENRFPETGRGFESYSLRHIIVARFYKKL